MMMFLRRKFTNLMNMVEEISVIKYRMQQTKKSIKNRMEQFC